MRLRVHIGNGKSAGSPNPVASDLPKNERRERRLPVPILEPDYPTTAEVIEIHSWPGT